MDTGRNLRRCINNLADAAAKFQPKPFRKVPLFEKWVSKIKENIGNKLKDVEVPMTILPEPKKRETEMFVQ